MSAASASNAVDRNQVAVLERNLHSNVNDKINLRISYLVTDEDTLLNVAILSRSAEDLSVDDFLGGLEENEKRLKLKRQDTVDPENPKKIIPAFTKFDGVTTTYKHFTNGEAYNFLDQAYLYHCCRESRSGLQR